MIEREAQRIASHAVVWGGGEELLLIAPVSPSGRPDGAAGRWTLPGGPVGHGEDPRAALERLAGTQTGMEIAVSALYAVTADIEIVDGVRVHTMRVLYSAEAVGRPGSGAALVGRAQARELPLAPPAAAVLGVDPAPPGEQVDEAEIEHDVPGARIRANDHRPHDREQDGPSGPSPTQRAGVYAVIVDAGRLLLTRLSGPHGRWTLPGGGLQHGELPLDALRREIWEETGLLAEIGELLDVDSVHLVGEAPGGSPEDHHAIRVVYAATVPPGSTPRVIEVGGSTVDVAWTPLADVPALDLTRLARSALRHTPPV